MNSTALQLVVFGWFVGGTLLLAGGWLTRAREPGDVGVLIAGINTIVLLQLLVLVEAPWRVLLLGTSVAWLAAALIRRVEAIELEREAWDAWRTEARLPPGWRAVTVFEDLTRPRPRPRWYAIVDGPFGIGKRYAHTDWGAFRRGVRALKRDVVRSYIREAT